MDTKVKEEKAKKLLQRLLNNHSVDICRMELKFIQRNSDEESKEIIEDVINLIENFDDPLLDDCTKKHMLNLLH